MQTCNDIRWLDPVFEKALHVVEGHLARPLTDDSREAFCSLNVRALEAALVFELSQAQGNLGSCRVVGRARQEVILGEPRRLLALINVLAERHPPTGASALAEVVLVVREEAAAAIAERAMPRDLRWSPGFGHGSFFERLAAERFGASNVFRHFSVLHLHSDAKSLQIFKSSTLPSAVGNGAGAAHQ